jgi:hypothetical protein
MASLWIATSCTPGLAPSQPAASDLKSANHSLFISSAMIEAQTALRGDSTG